MESRLAREAFCELEIPYRLLPASDSARVPVLSDLNTGGVTQGAPRIRSYLDLTIGASEWGGSST